MLFVNKENAFAAFFQVFVPSDRENAERMAAIESRSGDSLSGTLLPLTPLCFGIFDARLLKLVR